MKVFLFEDYFRNVTKVIAYNNRKRLEEEIAESARVYTEETYADEYWQYYDTPQEMIRAFYDDYIEDIENGNSKVQTWNDLRITVLPLE